MTDNNKIKYNLNNNVPPLPIPTNIPIILGSSSSSRQKILRHMKWNFSIISPDIDEKAIRNSDPYVLPLIIAIEKSKAIIDRFDKENKQNSNIDTTSDNKNNDITTSNDGTNDSNNNNSSNKGNETTEFILVTADQIVLYKDEIREKPENESQALHFLSSYSNSSVSTISAIVATHYPSERQSHEVVKATVQFDVIPHSVVQKVVNKGEIYASAGGFIIEDEDLNPFLLHIDGTMDSVLGMPLDATVRVIQAVLE